MFFAELIFFDDVPQDEIALVRGVGAPLRSLDVYRTLQRISRLAPGFAVLIKHIPSASFRVQLRAACLRRWPAYQVKQVGEVILVIPPQEETI